MPPVFLKRVAFILAVDVIIDALCKVKNARPTDEQALKVLGRKNFFMAFCALLCLHIAISNARRGISLGFDSR